MAEPKLTLAELFRPKLVRYGLLGTAGIQVYDASSNQLGLLRIQEMLGMSSSIPWWGWLAFVQALLFYSLFEYVRRNGGASSAGNTATSSSDDAEERRSHFINSKEALQSVELLKAQVAQLETRLSEAERIIEVLRPKLNTLISVANEADAKKVESDKRQLLAIIEGSLPSKPADLSSPRPFSPYYEDSTPGTIQMMVDRLGVSGEAVQEFVKSRVDAVKGNVLLSVVAEPELGVWQSDWEKQRWHVCQEQVQALKDVMGNLQQFRRRSA
jgi:hypothetical protein